MSGQNPKKPNLKKPLKPPEPEITIFGPWIEDMKRATEQAKALAQRGIAAAQENATISRALAGASEKLESAKRRFEDVKTVVKTNVAKVATNISPPPPGNAAAQQQTAREIGEKLDLGAERLARGVAAAAGGVRELRREIAEGVAAATEGFNSVGHSIQTATREVIEEIRENLAEPVQPPELQLPPVSLSLAEQVALRAIYKAPYIVAETTLLDYRLDEKRKLQLEKDEYRKRQEQKYQEIIERVKGILATTISYKEFTRIYSNPKIPRDIRVILNFEELNVSLKKLNDKIRLAQHQLFIKVGIRLEELGRDTQTLSEILPQLKSKQQELKSKQEELTTLLEKEREDQKLQEEDDANPFYSEDIKQKRLSAIESLKESVKQLEESLADLRIHDRQWRKLNEMAKFLGEVQETIPRLLEVYSLAFRREIFCAIGHPECEDLNNKIESKLTEFSNLRGFMYGGKTRRRRKNNRKTRSRKLNR